MDLTSAAAIARNFDAGFTNVLLSVPTDQWFGPVRSQYGVHLVFVDEKAEGRSPIIEDVEVAVRSDWESTRRRELAESRYSDMREQYDVRIDWPTGMAASPIETSGVE
jgi:parvulin-like peptidyl-prolyl isomerase